LNKIKIETMKNILILILFIPFISITCSDRTILKADKDNSGLVLPAGFGAIVVADALGPARHIVVDNQGTIYVSLSEQHNGGGIVILKDSNNDGRADDIKYTGDCQGTGIALHNGYLYFATDTSVTRYKLSGGELAETRPEMVISGFPLEYEHAAKTFTFDDAGNIYVNVGAPSNSCTEVDRAPDSKGIDPCPLLDTFGGIWQYKADQLNQVHLRQGRRFATGIRNAVAISWNRYVNQLYCVMHGRDQLYPLYKEHYSVEDGVNLPAEEFFEINEGDNFGWPYCYYDPFKNKKVLAPEYGGDGEITGRCDSMKMPIMTFPAHYAPNDILFYEGDQFPEKYRHGAFIAFHGSWNRAPDLQKGYNVVFVPFRDSLPSGNWEVFADNFAGTDKIYGPGDARCRPCGLAVGPDGSLYVVDSKVGRVWRIFYNRK
jgi:glucose/arabinose dehydrogenase